LFVYVYGFIYIRVFVCIHVLEPLMYYNF